MKKASILRGTARAIRRGNTAPSLGFVPYRENEDGITDCAKQWESDAKYDEMHRQREADYAEISARAYRDYRQEGYSHHQAMLMSGLGDPDSLGCS